MAGNVYTIDDECCELLEFGDVPRVTCCVTTRVLLLKLQITTQVSMGRFQTQAPLQLTSETRQSTAVFLGEFIYEYALPGFQGSDTNTNNVSLHGGSRSTSHGRGRDIHIWPNVWEKVKIGQEEDDMDGLGCHKSAAPY